ncbi:DHH family phosphoesterase [Treponema pectinovorum]|uniref:DHH family phosphoesterase n=1 Tax=Treponema pectinovorum TaxID=164 RepID=UPI0011C86423|nr:DHH family phosphoesterase [Treponema pectinovorum]
MNIISEAQFDAFKAFLDKHEFFFIAGHKEPDGDCVYSCLAMGEILSKMNLEYQLINAGPFKRNEIAETASFFTSTPQFLSEPERKKTGLIILDCSEMHRLGEIDGDLSNLDTFTIDHHLTADVKENCIIDSTAPATCCLLQQLYEKFIGDLDKKTATYIFLGQSTDTGYFKFLGSDSQLVFLQTARLVKAGVNPREIYDKITGGRPYSTRKLLGVLLTRAERACNDKLVITWETLEDTKKFGQEGRDSDSLYSILLSTTGVEVVVFLRQDTEFTCTAGLRSKKDCDVSAIAAKFGGGGHKNASGLSVQGRLENLIPEIKKEFAKVL